MGSKWWLYPRKDGRRFVWMGIGFGGQRLMVFPEEQLIATFTGWDIIKDPAIDAELANRLLPAVIAARCQAMRMNSGRTTTRVVPVLGRSKRFQWLIVARS